MAIKQREKNFKELLIAESFEYLYNRMRNPKTKDSSKEKIAIAMGKASISANQKHDIPQLTGLVSLIQKAAIR